jgi:hypothetical protein
MDGCLLCCPVEVSATSWSLVQRSPTDCGASLCVISKSREWRGPGPLWAVAPKNNNNCLIERFFLRCILYIYILLDMKQFLTADTHTLRPNVQNHSCTPSMQRQHRLCANIGMTHCHTSKCHLWRNNYDDTLTSPTTTLGYTKQMHFPHRSGPL